MLERAVCETAIVRTRRCILFVLSNGSVYVKTGRRGPGMCVQRDRSIIVADDSFAVLATIAPAWRPHI
jgi:hypothetical protein